jgi:hypothetical protein
MTLGEHALQALPSLGTHVAAGRSCCGVCACGMVGTRGVGTGEVVCRHDGYVNVNVVLGIECCDEMIQFCSLYIHLLRQLHDHRVYHDVRHKRHMRNQGCHISQR